jgi:hypothetical protein
VFVLLGFVDLTQGAAKERNTLWHTIAMAFQHLNHPETPFVLAYHVLTLTIPAIILGWVLQAFMVVLWERCGVCQ